MKKNDKGSNPALSMWQKVSLDGRIFKLAVEYRKKLGIPDYGFNSLEESDLWIENIKAEGRDKEIIKVIDNFIEESGKIVPYRGVLKESDFRSLMIEVFYSNEVSDEVLDRMKYSEMKVLIIKDGEDIGHGKGDVLDGVYIRLGTFSTIESILSFVASKKALIRSCLGLYRNIRNISKPKRTKATNNFKRDKMIIDLDDYSKREIEEYFDIKRKYKDDAISAMMKEMGYKGITGYVVKSVLHRRKLK